MPVDRNRHAHRPGTRKPRFVAGLSCVLIARTCHARRTSILATWVDISIDGGVHAGGIDTLGANRLDALSASGLNDA